MQIKINNRTYDPRLTALNNIRREAENFLCYGDVLFNESNGNLTKMNELILDDIGPQGLLNEKEKQTILHILKGLDQNATVANAPVLKKEVSSALTEAIRNSTNKNMIVITSLINSSINKLQPIAGPNGVPILTINDLTVTVPASVLLETGCALVGLSLYGGVGAALGAGICAAL